MIRFLCASRRPHAALLTLCATLSAQEPAAPPAPFSRLTNGLTHCAVPQAGSGQFGVALVLGGGGSTDPITLPGRARATVSALREQWKTESRRAAWRFELGPDAVVITGLHPRSTTAHVMARLEHLFAGQFDHEAVNPTGLTEDESAMAIGRARLAADDELNVYPGPMLEVRAHAALAPDQPSGSAWRGDPVRMAALGGQDLSSGLRAMATPHDAWLVVLGDFDTAAVFACLERLASGRNLAVDASSRVAHSPAQTTHDTWEPVASHDRVDGPFVTAAVRLSNPDGWSDVLAMTALRGAISRRFETYRGQEVNARFPFLAFDPLRGDAVACINRRGVNGSSLDNVRREIQELLDDVAEHGIPDAALTSARKAWVARLQPPPFSDAICESLQRAPAGFEARAGSLARAGYRGLLASPGIDDVTDAEVTQACRAALRAARIGWFALLPTGQ